MASQSMTTKNWQLKMADKMFCRLHNHLYQGDGDEHAAVVLARIEENAFGVVLLAQELYIAEDDKDFVLSERAYKKLKGEFITHHIVRARNERLVYLAIHNHGGHDSVGFSKPDLASHERGYPSLLKIAKGMPVGALVFAKNAVAADIWLPGGQRIQLDHMKVIGKTLNRLYSAPPKSLHFSDEIYDRQMRLLGSEGQVKLRSAKVGIIGLGGAGSQIAYLLAAIGVGEFVLIDPDVVETTNIPRLHGANKWHSMAWLTDSKRPRWLRRLGKRLSSSKVHLASKIIRERNPTAKITALHSDFCSSEADQFKDCDYLFLAADTHSARLQFNALVHQYLIAGVQVGAKAVMHKETGELTRVYSVVRPVTPDSGCLWCNELIKPSKLQDEAIGAEERKAIKYGLDHDEPAASIASLNATVTSQAVNDFMIWFTGLSTTNTHSNWYMFDALTRKAYQVEPRKDDNCPFCGSDSKKGSGNKHPLPYE